MGKMRTMAFVARILSLVSILAALTGPAAAQTTAPYATHVERLNARESLMLHDVAAQNKNTAGGALPTIARVQVGPFRSEMTNRTEDSINSTWGACRADTTMEALDAPAPNPINGHVSEADVDLPIGTLFGAGNQVNATYADGIVDRCGRP